MHTIRFSSTVATPREKVFEFYEQVDSLPKLTPSGMRFQVSSDAPLMRTGCEVILRFRILRIVPIRWVKLITDSQPPERFEDVQKSGPLKLWHHKHLFRETPRGTEVIDEVDYTLPLGLIGRIVDRLFVRRIMERMFMHRHKITAEMFGRVPANNGGQRNSPSE